MNVVNDDNYAEIVLKSDKLVVVDFYADWCAPCKALGPVFEFLANQTPDVTFVKVNVDESPDSSISNGVRSIPTIIFVKNGEVMDKIVGNTTLGNIQSKLNALK